MHAIQESNIEHPNVPICTSNLGCGDRYLFCLHNSVNIARLSIARRTWGHSTVRQTVHAMSSSISLCCIQYSTEDMEVLRFAFRHYIVAEYGPIVLNIIHGMALWIRLLHNWLETGEVIVGAQIYHIR